MASAAGGDRDASCTNDPNFAVICVFLEKFGLLCGLEYPNFLNLQNFIENTDEVPPELLDLLVKLLRKNRYTVHPELWERALVKFCHTYSNQDAWEVERFGYKKSRLPVKLNILKSLLESQFDRNGKLKTAVGTLKAADLRSHPIGRDKFGNAYWSIIDNKACLIRVYQEHLDEETWQIVASNRDEFAKLIQGLKSDKPVMPSPSICDDDSSSNSVNNEKATEGSTAETRENGDTSTVEVRGNGNDGEKENIILKITKNRIEESVNDEELDDEEDEEEVEEEEEEEDEEGNLSKEVVAEPKTESESEPHQQSRPSLLASKPPSKKPLVHPKKRANEIENETDSKKPKERLTLLGQQHKDKKKKTENDNDNMDEEEVEEEEEYSDEEELEEEEVEEEEDEEDEEGFEGEDDPEVGEPIEDPVVQVVGEGSGVDNKGTFLEFISDEYCESDCEFSEVIEEDVRYFYGDGSGNACQVGNAKQNINESKPDITGQAECFKDGRVSTEGQTSEPLKDPSPSDKTTNTEAESHQNNVEPNSSNNLDLSNIKNDVIEQEEPKESKFDIITKSEPALLNEKTATEEVNTTNDTLLVEVINVKSLENVETSLTDKDNQQPVVDKNHPPERDKLEIDDKPKCLSNDDIIHVENKTKILPVEMPESVGEIVASVMIESNTKSSTVSILEMDDSKISNGGQSQVDDPNNIVSTSSINRIVTPLGQKSNEIELSISEEKLVTENSKTSISSSLFDESVIRSNETSPTDCSKIIEVNSEITKLKEEKLIVPNPENVILTSSDAKTIISEIKDERPSVDVKILEIEFPTEKVREPETVNTIISSKIDKSIVKQLEKVETHIIKKSSSPDTEKVVAISKSKSPSKETLENDPQTSSCNVKGYAIVIPEKDMATSSTAKDCIEPESKNFTALPAKDVLSTIEESATQLNYTLDKDSKLTNITSEKMTVISSNVTESIDPELEMLNVLPSEAEQPTIEESESLNIRQPKSTLSEKITSAKAMEPMADESKVIIVKSLKPSDRNAVEKTNDTPAKPKDTLITVPKKITIPHKLEKSEGTFLSKTEKCIATSEPEKSITKNITETSVETVLRKSEISISKIDKPISTIPEKSGISNCEVEELLISNNTDKPSIPDSNENDSIPIEPDKLLNKTCKLTKPCDPSVELNGIIEPESGIEDGSSKVKLNQAIVNSEMKSINNKTSISTPDSKPTDSEDSEATKEGENKVTQIDEVSEPPKTNIFEEITIPEIKITEVENLPKDELESKCKIEPNHLKAPEIDITDCTTKMIDAKASNANIQSFSLDFNDDEESLNSDSTAANTPIKRGRKPKVSPTSKQLISIDPLEIDEPKSDTKSKTIKKRGGARKKRIDVEPALIIKEDENETPVRQSRRIAQLKIREEAERRKLEEMVLKQMKEDSDRKKKEEEKKKNPNEADSDPDAEIEQEEEEEEEEETDSGSEKKILKKPKKKKKKDGSQPWQTSSGSSDSEDNDEELYILDHEEDEELPPLKSDHEFSPESDMEDETQVVPTKRARTAKKDKLKVAEEEEEEENDTDENPEHACQKCGKHDHPEWILLCDICDKGYHCSCLTPVLFIIPEGDWHCPPCQHQKLINIFSVQLEEFDAMIKQKELEDNRKRRMHYTNVSAQNVLPISKKEPRARGRKKNRSQTRAPRRRKRSSDDDDNDDERKHRKSSSSTSSSSSSSSSSSGDSDENSSDDEPIYKLRKRRQTVVSYRFNEFDDLINSAIKDEMDEVKGAGNLGRGKDISTIIEADKEEKRLKEQDIIHTDLKEEAPDPSNKAVNELAAEPKTEDMDLEEPESKKILNDEDLLNEEDEKEKSEAESDTSEIIRRPSIIKRSSTGSNRGKKKSRKLNSLDIESDDDGSDEDFKGSSSDSEDEEELSISSASESSLENKWSKKRKKNKSGRRLRQRRRRNDRAFINDNSDDSDEVKRPVRKRKKKEESDFSDFDDDDEEEEDIDSEDLCETSTNSDSDSDGAWKPKNKRRKTSSSRKQKVVHKRPAIMIHRKKTKKLGDDEKSFKVGMTKKKVLAKPDSDDSDDENKARKTRGRKITYLEDFDESSDDGIRPGVKRPDTPPEERALFIKKQEEIKRMLAAKNTDAAKMMATPVLKPLKSTIEEPLISDSISTVPKQIIQNAKVLDPDFLKNKQNNEFDEDFDDQLPEDFDPEDMDEEEIAKMMEEEDFAQQQLKLAGEAIRNKKLKEAELNRKKELEKSKQSHLSAKLVSETIIPPNINSPEPIGPTPLTQLRTIQPPITSAPMIPQARQMLHPPSSILSHGNPLPPGIPSHMPPGPSPIPNIMMPSMSDTMRLLKPEFDMKKRNRKSILDLGLPRSTTYQATHIPSQMPPQLQQQLMSRPPVAHLPPMAHLPPSAHMPPGPQGPRAFQMQRHLPPHIMNQIPAAHSMHSNPVRMAPPNVTVLPPNISPNIVSNPIPNANEPIIPTTVLSVANQKLSEPPTLIPSTSHSTSVINSLILPPNVINPTVPTTLSVEALNAASQSELDALKRRGRRKKITPLRDPSKPNPGLADLSQAHSGPAPKTVEVHKGQVEKKSNPILAERLTSSPAGGAPDSPVKSVLVAPSTQIFPTRTSGTTSVITRLQQPLRPHQTPPFPQGIVASSRYFAPPIPRPPHHPVRSPFSGNPPPGMPPVTEPGPHYLTSDSRQPGGGHMFRPSLLHGFAGAPNPLHPMQIPSTQAHLVRGPTPPRDYSGGPTHPPPSFSTSTSQYGDFYSSSNQAVPAVPVERHQQPSPEQPTTFDQYEPLKSIPVTVAESVTQFEATNDDDTGGDGSQDGGDPGDNTGGDSNSGPTSEFSGLVSYFSSQQDDLDT